MRRVMAVLLVLVFSMAAWGACGDPCEKAFEKYAKCLKEKGVPEERIKRFKKKKEKFVKECKEEGDKSKVKKCLDKDCKDFRSCLKKASK